MSVSAPKSTIMLIKIVGGDKQILEVNERRNENRRSDVFLRRSWLKTSCHRSARYSSVTRHRLRFMRCVTDQCVSRLMRDASRAPPACQIMQQVATASGSSRRVTP
jgi:hypothetical protein